MFRSAVLKLTVWQMAALLLVCLFFSFPAYNIAAARLRRGAEQQTEYIQRFPQASPEGLVPFLQQRREEQLSQDRHELIVSFVMLNGSILLLGTIGSYLFARRTLRPIEEAHASQSRFTSDASHELRTPLATMQTEIDVALRNNNLRLSDAKAVLRSNLEDIARLRSLSEQLLYLTRMDAKDVVMKTVDLSRVLKTQVKRLEKQYNIKISSTIAKSLRVSANNELLEQLVSILVDNAVKYAGDKPPKITISAAKVARQLELRVQDQGVGIVATDLPFVFDRFYRGSMATKQSSGGHGLGLALAKAITEAHHGDIIVHSSPAKGSEFIVRLPIG